MDGLLFSLEPLHRPLEQQRRKCEGGDFEERGCDDDGDHRQECLALCAFIECRSLRRVLYTSCAPVGTGNLSAQLQDFLCQLHPNSRILLMLNPSFCVPFSPQNPPVLLPPKSVCLAWDSPFPASAVAKGITH